MLIAWLIGGLYPRCCGEETAEAFAALQLLLCCSSTSTGDTAEEDLEYVTGLWRLGWKSMKGILGDHASQVGLDAGQPLAVQLMLQGRHCLLWTFLEE